MCVCGPGYGTFPRTNGKRLNHIIGVYMALVMERFHAPMVNDWII